MATFEENVQKAILLVMKNGTSTTMLQRQLRVGYSEADAIMEKLEELKIVGKALWFETERTLNQRC